MQLKLEELESRVLLTRYILVNLGPGYSLGINQNGDTVGRADIGDVTDWAAEWDANGHRTVFDLNPPSSANAINDLDQVVGRESHAQSGSFPFRCDNSKCQELPLLDGDNYGSAYGINNAGQAVGVSDGQYFRAVLWQKGQGIVLGPGIAQAINNAGLVVGWVPGADAPFAWKHGQRVGLVGIHGVPYAVNDNFQIVGGDSLNNGWLWSSGEVTALPFVARAINNAGAIVGDNSSQGVDPKIWQNGKSTLLQDLLVDNQGFTLKTAMSINDAGQIVGRAERRDQTIAYRLDPVGDAPAWMGWALGLAKKEQRLTMTL